MSELPEHERGYEMTPEGCCIGGCAGGIGAPVVFSFLLWIMFLFRGDFDAQGVPFFMIVSVPVGAVLGAFFGPLAIRLCSIMLGGIKDIAIRSPNRILAAPPGLLLTGCVIAPVAACILVFGPGLSGTLGSAYRVPIGLLWFAGFPIALYLLVCSLPTGIASRKIKGASLSILLGYVAAGMWLSGSTPTVQKVKNMIHSEIPPSSTKPQVVSYLESKSIESNDDKAKIEAIIPDTIIDAKGSYIKVTFAFTKEQKLGSINIVPFDAWGEPYPDEP